MITNLPYVDVNTLQNTLNETIGPSIFVVTSHDVEGVAKCYLEFSDTTPQADVDIALNIANTQAYTICQETKVRLYQAIQYLGNKQINIILKPVFTEAEIQEAASWLSMPSTAVPACVLYLATKDNISNEAAANNIVNSNTQYTSLVNQIKLLVSEGQTSVLNSTDFYTVKVQAENYINQIKNVT